MKKTKTDGNGKYTIDVAGFDKPYLIKVSSKNEELLSVGFEAGIVNIHPLSDLSVRLYGQMCAMDFDSVFEKISELSKVPGKEDFDIIAGVVKEIVWRELVRNNVDPESFDFITTPFDANGAGFDAMLDGTRVTISNDGVSADITVDSDDISQVSAIALEPQTGNVKIKTRTTSPEGVSENDTTVFIPSSGTVKGFVHEINAMLDAFKNTLNGKNSDSFEDELRSYFSDDFLDEGINQQDAVEYWGAEFQDVEVEVLQIAKVLSFDEKNSTVSVELFIETSRNGNSETSDFEMILKKHDEKWQFYGNQINGIILFDVWPQWTEFINREDIGKAIDARFDALEGVLAGADFSTAGFENVVMPEDGIGNPGWKKFDRFHFHHALPDFPPAGTVFEINVRAVSGAKETYYWTLPATTNETVSLTNLYGLDLNDLHADEPFKVHWTLPKTFAIEEVDLMLHAINEDQVTVTIYPDREVLSTATEGYLALPAAVDGKPVSKACAVVIVTGRHGEKTWAGHWF